MCMPVPVVSGVGGSLPCTPHTHPGLGTLGAWSRAADIQLSNCSLEPATGGDPLSIIMMIGGQLVDTSTGGSGASLLVVATCLLLPGYSNVWWILPVFCPDLKCFPGVSQNRVAAGPSQVPYSGGR